MNRYPLWKYLTIAAVLLIAVIYTLPNFYGEAPAIQISGARTGVKVDAALEARVKEVLRDISVTPTEVTSDASSLKVRFESTDEQYKAKDAIHKALVPDPQDETYTVSLNLLPRTPSWLKALYAGPMYLGLDLRGGIHFTLQVDLRGVLAKKSEALVNDLRVTLRDKGIRHGGVSREGNEVAVRLRDLQELNKAKDALQTGYPDYQFSEREDAAVGVTLVLTPRPQLALQTQEQALKQNIVTLHNRINALGVAEPVIAQQGAERIVVQLPGVQDVERAQKLIGRTATLEMRLVDHSAEADAAAIGTGAVPFGSERFARQEGGYVVLKKQVLTTGDNLTDAQTSFDQQTQQPIVSLSMDSKGGRIMRETSRENLKKGMAILLFEKGKGQAISVATIQGELGTRFQISGNMNLQQANDLALLLRAGALAAPMEIIESRIIGPSLGADNIAKGFSSVTWGFAAVMAFMCVYYMLFGLFSSLALGVNLLLLISVLSMLQATLTLPGVAAMALALGMAIDSNVLINERVREELRAGVSPQAAIHAGYDRAWSTILDSNVTTLIAGIALLAFGSGPIRGFAVVHCLGILTSMFSAVLFSRGLVNLWYGRRSKLKSVSIGTVWRG